MSLDLYWQQHRQFGWAPEDLSSSLQEIIKDFYFKVVTYLENVTEKLT
jgi:hypothetical protein